MAVIVNFRTADKTIAAVRSLQSSEPPLASIIVVDNGSGDDSRRRIAASLQGIRLIEESANRGFSAGCNAGIRVALESGAERVLLLNADASVLPHSVAAMTKLLDDDQRIGIVGGLLTSTTRPATIESFGISYSVRTGRMWNRDSGKAPSSVDRSDRHDVDAVSGCAMMIKRPVLERVGFLDEDYFFGFEDIDFCLRARAAGFLVAAAGNATVVHEGQASVGRHSAQRIYFATRNHLLLARRAGAARTGPGRWLQTGTILTFNLGYVLFSSEAPRIAGLRAFAEGARDCLRGRP